MGLCTLGPQPVQRQALQRLRQLRCTGWLAEMLCRCWDAGACRLAGIASLQRPTCWFPCLACRGPLGVDGAGAGPQLPQGIVPPLHRQHFPGALCSAALRCAVLWRSPACRALHAGWLGAAEQLAGSECPAAAPLWQLLQSAARLLPPHPPIHRQASHLNADSPAARPVRVALGPPGAADQGGSGPDHHHLSEERAAVSRQPEGAPPLLGVDGRAAGGLQPTGLQPHTIAPLAQHWVSQRSRAASRSCMHPVQVSNPLMKSLPALPFPPHRWWRLRKTRRRCSRAPPRCTASGCRAARGRAPTSPPPSSTCTGNPLLFFWCTVVPASAASPLQAALVPVRASGQLRLGWIALCWSVLLPCLRQRRRSPLCLLTRHCCPVLAPHNRRSTVDLAKHGDAGLVGPLLVRCGAAVQRKHRNSWHGNLAWMQGECGGDVCPLTHAPAAALLPCLGSPQQHATRAKCGA